jgi:probable HAF family extracellular repeat protein
MKAWMLALLSLLAACGQDPTPLPSAKGVEPRVAVARESTVETADLQEPWLLNPAEELSWFAPDGLLRWSAVEGADFYEVWALDYARTQVYEFSGPLVSREYRFTQLLPASQYQIQVWARVAGRWTVSIDQFSVIHTADGVLEPRLSNSQEELEAFAANGTLRWTPVEGADSYEVWIYQDRGLQALVENSGSLRVTQYSVRSLPAGRSYFAQVWARVDGEFYAGGALQVSVVAESSRARIVNPQDELDAFASDGLLRWSSAPGATLYEVWIFDDPNSARIHESSGQLTTRTYRTRTLEPGRTYYVQVYAWVDGAWQVGSPVRISTASVVDVARLANPQEEIEAFATNGTLRWNPVPGADRYEVWIYGNAGLGVVTEAGRDPSGTAYTVGRLCRDGVYYVELWARVAGSWQAGWATRINVTQGESPAQCVPPVPMVSFNAEPYAPRLGQSVTLTWTSRFADHCTAYEGWSGIRSPGGSAVVGPLWTATRFGLVCEGPSGTTQAYLSLVLALPKYVATELPLGTASALNQVGDVSGANFYRPNMSGGNWVPCPAGFLGGQFVSLDPDPDPLRCLSSMAPDVNAGGEVVIESGFVYRDGVFKWLDGFLPSAINDLGQIAGSDGLVSHAAVWVDGVVTRAPMPAGRASIANDLNAHGVVVGDWWIPTDYRPLRTKAFVWGTGDLGSLGGDATHAEAVSDNGVVVGWSTTRDGAQHAVQWGPSGNIEDLGTLGCSGSYCSSMALGINSIGHIVGQSTTLPRPGILRSETSAFLSAYGFMYDLNDQITVRLENQWGASLWLVSAADINDAGQIVADACTIPLLYSCRAYLLTPIPEQ